MTAATTLPNRDVVIKAALDRLVGVYQRRPDMARSTSRTTGRIEAGTSCAITDGVDTVVSDMPEIMGGDGAGPTPGFFARAGIIGCVAIALKNAAAQAEIPIDAVDVSVETDFDDRAGYGMIEGTNAPRETRVEITLTSDAPESVLRRLVDEVLLHDTWFAALRDAQVVKTDLKLGRRT